MTIELIKETLSKDNNWIRLFAAGSSRFLNQNKTVLFIGVVHGDEPEGETLIENLMHEVNINPDITDRNKVLFIPVLNPDGKALGTRGNASGVDINRNFPTKNWESSKEQDEYYSGPEPASEIETRFLIEIIDEFKPDMIITLHTPYRVVNYDGPAKGLAEEISRLNGYPVQESIGYPTPGSFGTYAGIERNIPTVTLELPDNTPTNQLWTENKQAFLYIVGS